MAKKYATRIDVTGKSIQDIMLDPSIYSLKEGPTRQIARRVISAANKRLRSFARADVYSPPASKVAGLADVFKREMGDISVLEGFERFGEIAHDKMQKGFSIADLSNVNEVRRELRNALNFLNAEGSTVRDWKRIRKNALYRLNVDGFDMTEDEFDKVFRIYGLIKDLDPSFRVKSIWNPSDKVIKMITRAIRGEYGKEISFNEIYDKAKKILEEAYDEYAKTEYSGTADMFDEGFDPGSGI